MENIIENNRLIAEFKGWESYKYDNLPNRVHKGDQELDLTSTRYHESWDWLMPVVYKLGTIKNVEINLWLPKENSKVTGFNIICGNKYIGTRIVGKGENRHLDLLNATYIGCAEFIKWYIENK